MTGISKGTRFKVFTRDGFACRYCGRKPPEVVLHCDHVHPQCAGGSDEIDNLVTSCADCNLSKGGRTLPAIATEAVRPTSPSWPVGFYVLTGEPRGWQGIARALVEGVLVLSRFSWMDGRITGDVLVPFADAVREGWVFFGDYTEFRIAAARSVDGEYEPEART